MKRKSEKIEIINNLLTDADKPKGKVLAIASPEPSVYLYDGKQITEQELEEMGKNFEKTVIFTPKG